MSPSIQHIVQTRFAVRTKKLDDVVLGGPMHRARGPEPLSPEWVAGRFDLFERYLLPSMRAQTMPDFTWYLYVHPDFNPEWCDRLRAYDDRIRVMTDPVTPVHGNGILACTRIDSDDGFAADALEVVHAYAEKFARGFERHRLVRLQMGWWHAHGESRVYQKRGWSFLTLLERKGPYRGALANSCMEIGRMYPEWVEKRPLWIRVTHEGNVRNAFDRTLPTVALEDIHRQGFGWLVGMPSLPRVAPVEAWEPPEQDDSLPRVAVVMQTTDRRRAARHVPTNYVRPTVHQLVQQGVSLNLQLSKLHDLQWIRNELGPSLVAKVHLLPTTQNLSRNATGLAALGSVDLDACDWVLLLEDDLRICKDFVGSVARWLQQHGRPDRHVFRLGFHRPPNRGVSAFDHPLKALAGVQAVAWRVEDLRDFLAWVVHLPSWRGYGPRRPDPGIAFDKFIAQWALAKWPGVPEVLSWPFFVDHIGNQSSIHARGPRVPGFGGVEWRFKVPRPTVREVIQPESVVSVQEALA